MLVRLSFELKDYLYLNIIPVIRQHFGSEALGYAVKMEFLARNVAEAVDPPHPEHTNMATLAPDDISTFLATAKKTHYYTLFYIALFTGMRRGELLALTWANINLFLSELSCRNGKNAYYRAIRTFCNWLYRQGYIKDNPIARVDAPKMTKVILPSLTYKQVEYLIQQAENIRDKCIISLFADSGIRLSELVNIKASHIDWESNTIIVWEKGGK